MKTRRSFLRSAAAIGAAAAWGKPARLPAVKWRERRELFPEGVASGDPDDKSVILWTRAGDASVGKLFVTTATAPVSQAADGTCRVLAGGLKPAHVYWFRFMAPDGSGSRIGRTITAPAPNDPRPVRFAFVSCQNANQGAQNAYRRMIHEDERATESERLGFVLHLGDFIYEIVWYPEDRPTYYDRRIREVVRYPHGEKIRDFMFPPRWRIIALYTEAICTTRIFRMRGRAGRSCRCGINHEFSWQGWQGIQQFFGKDRPAQTVKVAANQAFFEFQPARMARPQSKSLETSIRRVSPMRQ